MPNEGLASRPLVYIAGPYSKPDLIQNIYDSIQEAEVLLAEGLAVPHIPHLTAMWHLVKPHAIEFWYEYDLVILARCDAVLRLPGASTGADAEVAFAQH